VLESLERADKIEYVGLTLAIAGIVTLAVTAGMSVLMLFFAPLIMIITAVSFIPYGVATIFFGWVARKRHAAMAWFSIIVGALLSPAAFALAILFGEIVGKATS